MGRYHHPHTTRLGGRHLPGVLTQQERQPQAPRDRDTSVSSPAANGMEPGTGRRGQPSSARKENAHYSWGEPLLWTGLRESSPNNPEHYWETPLLAQHFEGDVEEGMAGTSRRPAAPWHERRPPVLFHGLDNYFLNLSLLFAIFHPPTARPCLL